MTELECLAIGLDTDKGTVHSYLPFYDTVFREYRKKLYNGEPVSLLEIGVYGGGSIHLWRNYFGPRLSLHCVDIKIPDSLPQRTSFHLGNACDQLFFESNLAQHEHDIIIDDGSHAVEDQIACFSLFCSRLKPGGIFLIEDVQSLDDVKLIESGASARFETLDFRELKGRYDDILLVFRKP